MLKEATMKVKTLNRDEMSKIFAGNTMNPPVTPPVVVIDDPIPMVKDSSIT